MPTPTIRSEGRLLYALLDAVDDSGRITAPLAVRWRDLKSRMGSADSYEREAGSLLALLTELEKIGAFKGSWIEARWRSVQSRIGEN